MSRAITTARQWACGCYPATKGLTCVTGRDWRPVIDEPCCEATRTGVFSSVGSPNNLDNSTVARLLAGWSLFGGDGDASQGA